MLQMREKEVSAEGKEKLLTTEGSLLKTIQDRCHMYARVHLPRILSKSLAEKIGIVEMEDRANPAQLQIYRNKRRPWQHFRNLILEDLPRASGLHEVNTLLSMTREDNDTADRWAQRYHVGRGIIGKRMGTNLSDAVYVELCLRGLREGEIADMVRALMAQDRADRARPRPLGGGAVRPERDDPSKSIECNETPPL